ncbi:GGDEF domain-containing response regulator [Leptolyngbyaceae cyanobacterium CCMR0082]|uniref:GGDEF domain-containing response regulator n=2 Tax=Adonisia turfae TaxID=2950184 RepID=A0A6M0SF06_9CYAN|nr:EAL domain-containing protein [Adonisia turfae]MDV3353271.1 EAL domain-containing protein [Leptothoe sp. LEGE 181152]NEZ56881.1 GGDEF domain-containing response regulator [Adonisia turfae CCMR0081]NEZ67098.1 GGDEF domain-containing response regulator [Adonisia turfae CCMR0082]
MTTGIDALLIEDNISDAQLFQELLSSSELLETTLHHIERFNEAIRTLETNNNFDVVLLDLCLPDGQGVDLVKQIKTLVPKVPVVVLTGIQDQNVAIAALQEGAQDYLVKSDTFSPERLQRLGYVDVGNLLAKTIQYAIERTELTKKLEISEERYALAVQGANDGIWDWDLRTNTICYSLRWKTMLGLNHSNLSDSPEEWLSRIHADSRSEFEQTLQEHLASQRSNFQFEYRMRHADGSYRWMLTRGMALWDEEGQPYRIAGSQTDTTERKHLEQSLYQEKELAQITLHSIGDAVITTDAHGYIKDFNPVAEKLTGWKANDAKKRSISEVCTIVDSATQQPLQNPALQAIKEKKAISLSNHPTLISKTGQEFAIGDSAAPIRADNGEVLGTVLVFHDVTEERGRAKQLAWQASHDPLTELFNRKKFMHALDNAIEELHGAESQHMLCYMDLDHFKAVNDTCGHAAGDQLLQQVADLWRRQIRQTDVLARLGGDEFGLLLYNCKLDRATEIAKSFCQGIQGFRFVFDGKMFNIGVSIGIVPMVSNTVSSKQVMQLADKACYVAKNKGRNRVQIYHSDDVGISRQTEDVQWFSRVTEALDGDQFQLYYQTIESAVPNSSDIRLCEILLRLPNTRTGEIAPPMAFLPTAERYNLMPRIDRWVVESFFSYLTSHTPMPKTIYSVNLSGASINDENFIGFLEKQLRKYPVNPAILCFEITETLAIANLQKAADLILKLKKIGCHFALDDFGSGMSSFSYLRHLPVDYLKIDGNFVKESPTDDLLCAMLAAINNIGHIMGLKTIAEYVESPAVLKKVQALGVDYVQGYAISHPQPLV